MKTYLNFRNNIILLYKNLPAKKLFSVLFPRFILDLISLFQFLFRFEFRNMMAVTRAHFFLLGHIRAIRGLRRQNLAICSPAMHPEMYPGSIVYRFFILGKRRFGDLHFKI
jgi:hypothetical protein